MNPLERAAALHQESDFILNSIQLQDAVSPYGEVTPGGSYFLNVMVYPDIDVYIPTLTIPQLFQIGARIAAFDPVWQVVFEKSGDPTLPGGFYLKPRINYGDWGRPWKVDIWSLDEALIEQKMADMRRFKQKMTSALREQIIRYKISILTDELRTPTYSGYFIYKAFLDEGITEFDQVTLYLKAHGIQMEERDFRNL
jgi:hypothetical protein